MTCVNDLIDSAVRQDGEQHFGRGHVDAPAGPPMQRGMIFIELMTSDRKRKADVEP